DGRAVVDLGDPELRRWAHGDGGLPDGDEEGEGTSPAEAAEEVGELGEQRVTWPAAEARAVEDRVASRPRGARQLEDELVALRGEALDAAEERVGSACRARRRQRVGAEELGHAQGEPELVVDAPRDARRRRGHVD